MFVPAPIVVCGVEIPAKPNDTRGMVCDPAGRERGIRGRSNDVQESDSSMSRVAGSAKIDDGIMVVVDVPNERGEDGVSGNSATTSEAGILVLSMRPRHAVVSEVHIMNEILTVDLGLRHWSR